jgi:HK97 gp10 family phage protein
MDKAESTSFLKWYGKEVLEQVHSNTEKILIKGGYMIQEDAQNLCPVDTGRLKASISTNWSNSGMGTAPVSSPAESGDGVSRPESNNNEFVVDVGTNVEYASRVEFGSGGRDKYRGQPYLRPAYEKNISKIQALFDKLIK